MLTCCACHIAREKFSSLPSTLSSGRTTLFLPWFAATKDSVLSSEVTQLQWRGTMKKTLTTHASDRQMDTIVIPTSKHRMDDLSFFGAIVSPSIAENRPRPNNKTTANHGSSWVPRSYRLLASREHSRAGTPYRAKPKYITSLLGSPTKQSLQFIFYSDLKPNAKLREGIKRSLGHMKDPKQSTHVFTVYCFYFNNLPDGFPP